MADWGPLSNQTLGGKYILGELLGQGGFGAVYQARHTLLNRQQAIKILLEQHFTSPKFRKRAMVRRRGLQSLPLRLFICMREKRCHLLYAGLLLKERCRLLRTWSQPGPAASFHSRALKGFGERFLLLEGVLCRSDPSGCDDLCYLAARTAASFSGVCWGYSGGFWRDAHPGSGNAE